MNILYTKDYIKQQIKYVANNINSSYENIDEPLVIIPILNGGVFFYVDLVRELKIPNTMGVISTSLYPNGKELPELQIKFQDAEIESRNVLLVDEICYSGKTLKQLIDYCYKQGAKEVKSCVLVDQLLYKNKYEPDFSAIKYEGDAWVYGFGMDINGLHRELEEIRF